MIGPELSGRPPKPGARTRLRVNRHGVTEVVALPDAPVHTADDAPADAPPATTNGASSDTAVQTAPERIGDVAVADLEPARPLRVPVTEVTGDGHEIADVEWCAILLARAGRVGEFRVAALDSGHRRVVARSPSFRVSLSGQIRKRGAARQAHDVLVKRLLGTGWRRIETRGRWYDGAFTRSRPQDVGPAAERLLILCKREPITAAYFYADEIGEFGNGSRVGQSRRFAVRPWGRVRATDEARAVHEQLLEQLRSTGWTTADTLGPEWYVCALTRPKRFY